MLKSGSLGKPWGGNIGESWERKPVLLDLWQAGVIQNLGFRVPWVGKHHVCFKL